MRQRHRRRAADPPARTCCGRDLERIARLSRPAPQQQHRRAPIRGSELKPAGCGLVGRLHLGNYRGKAPVAQAILGKGECHDLVPALAIDQLRRREPRLLKARRVEIEARQSPDTGRSGFTGKTRGHTGSEQGRRCIVAQGGRCSRDLVQAATVQPAMGKPRVDRLDPEW